MGVPRILHYPGSKWSMAEWIISHMPPHTTYLEPYFGSGGIFFNKPRVPLETINDIDGDVVNLFRVVRTRSAELAEAIRWTPYSRDEYYTSYEPVEDELERARRFLVRCRQAIGTKTSDRTGWKSNIDIKSCSTSPPAAQWSRIPKKIMQVAERLEGVQIEQQPALQVIERYEKPSVLIYADPPYLLDTRSGRMYKHEMTPGDHETMLKALERHPGPVLLSGYANRMYDEMLRHWRREAKEVMAEGGQPRTEVLWINPIAAESIGRQLTLF
ncbi:DNA adenine methylase [Paenibacillus ehimensis]|uniref:DNA adenine methylase n=1 Tax=Paenibacillus ehimensis TaxID=79264 RepID=UPI003D2D5BE6